MVVQRTFIKGHSFVYRLYQAKVHIPKENKVMIQYGSTEREFKKRCSEHKSSFRTIPKSHTALFSYIWKLKEKKTPYFVNWSIKARGHAFSDQNTMLNRRDELLEPCGHRRKHLLVSLFPPKKKEPPDTTVKQQGEPKQFFFLKKHFRNL